MMFCRKNGENHTTVYSSSANAATFGNILIGGLIGAFIDGGIGAGYDYPESLTNHLKCHKLVTYAEPEKSGQPPPAALVQGASVDDTVTAWARAATAPAKTRSPVSPPHPAKIQAPRNSQSPSASANAD
jgi:hypothetical protein